MNARSLRRDISHSMVTLEVAHGHLPLRYFINLRILQKKAGLFTVISGWLLLSNRIQ